MTKIIDGTRLARSFREDTSQAAGALAAQGCPPKLAVVVATEDESTGWYVRSIAQAARQIGITCDIVDVGPTASTEEIRSALVTVSQDPDVHGIILQTPLPAARGSGRLTGGNRPRQGHRRRQSRQPRTPRRKRAFIRAGHGTRGDGLAGVSPNFATRQERGRRGPIDRRGSPHRAPAHPRRRDRHRLPSADVRSRRAHRRRRDRGRRSRNSQPHHGVAHR